MLSIRALARSLPRTSSRIVSFGTKSSLRPSFYPQIRPQISPRLATAAFSTSRARFDDFSQQLAAKLTKEVELETEESATQVGSDTSVAQFIEQNPDWVIEDPLGEQDVFLQRKYEDEEITVHFTIAEFNTAAGIPEDEMDSALPDEDDFVGQDDKIAVNQGRPGSFKQAPEDSLAPADREDLAEDEYNTPSYPVFVNVLVQRPGDKGSLKFQLSAEDGEFIIHQVAHLPAASPLPAAQLLRAPTDNIYTGPPFAQLDEEIQGMLENYLNARGITSSLAMFIPDYVDVKEQREYVGWLNRVRDFVE